MNILVSACLLGVQCRYDGSGAGILQSPFCGNHVLVPACPEQLGGMATPRDPAERKAGQVVSRAGNDVTAYYKKGAEETLRLAKLYGCRYAILKERSPSCGHGEIYDGTFTGTKISGSGVTAELLEANGIHVIGESRMEEFFEELKKEAQL